MPQSLKELTTIVPLLNPKQEPIMLRQELVPFATMEQLQGQQGEVPAPIMGA